MSRMIAAFGLLVVGCAGEASYVCSDNVFSEVRYSRPVDCAYSRRVTALAVNVAFPHAGIAPNLRTTVLAVQDVRHWKDEVLGIEVDGMYTPGRIEVGLSYGALVHEMFHAKDWLWFDVSRLVAPLHANWDTDGRDATGWAWRKKVDANGILVDL